MGLKNTFISPKKCGAGSLLPPSVSMVIVPANARDLAAAGPSSHCLLLTICSTFAPGPEPRPPPPLPGRGFCCHRVARVDGSAGYSSRAPESSPQLPPPRAPRGFSNTRKTVRPRHPCRGRRGQCLRATGSVAPSASPAVLPPPGGPVPHHENLIPNAFAARGREAVVKEAPSWGLDLRWTQHRGEGLVWRKGRELGRKVRVQP